MEQNDIYVGITDSDWFTELSRAPLLDEVNFWQPSGKRQFKALKPGGLFLFKKHAPDDFIVGGGFYSHHSILPVSLAWAAFGPKNGAKTEEEMRARVDRYRKDEATPNQDYLVGCILLESPFFLSRKDWIPVANWSKPIVQGRGYNSSIEPGKSYWQRVQTILQSRELSSDLVAIENFSERRFGSPRMVMPRLGQGSFRVIVTDSYKRQCAITGSHVLHVLEAAHVKPYGQGGTHAVSNGVLLRQDFHTLLDRGYLTITPDYKVEVSRKIKEEFNNGKEYYAMHGRDVLIPNKPEFRLDPELLSWHNEQIFLR